MPELVRDENYGRVVDYWNKYAQKNNEGKDVNDETRLGVALSFWKKEQPTRALELIDRYLQGEEIPKYSAMALDMALGIYVDEQAWSKVTALVNLAKDKWKLDPKQKVHIEYAQAMAYENLGETERSTPLLGWLGFKSAFAPVFACLCHVLHGQVFHEEERAEEGFRICAGSVSHAP